MPKVLSHGHLGEGLFQPLMARVGETPNNRAICVTDAFSPRMPRQLFAEGAEAIVLCFMTTRTVLVSSWLYRAQPCFDCFSRRWWSNLASNEHAPSYERLLGSLDDQISLRSFDLPPSVFQIALELIVDSATNEVPFCVVREVDVRTCEVASSHVLPVHGCPNCRMTVAKRDSTQDFRTLFAPIRSHLAKCNP